MKAANAKKYLKQAPSAAPTTPKPKSNFVTEDDLLEMDDLEEAGQLRLTPEGQAEFDARKKNKTKGTTNGRR